MNRSMLVLTGVVLGALAASGCGGNSTQEPTGTAGAGGETTTPSGGGGTGGETTGGGGAGATGGTGGAPTGGGGAGGTGGTGGTTTTTTSTTSSTATDLGDAMAVHVLRIGDKLPNGAMSSVAWKEYGFNLDGKVSVAASNDLCKPSSGATKSVPYPDGNGGIDNSFGKNLLPIFTSLASDLSTGVNMGIDQGDFTILVSIEGITPGATGTFPAKLYTGAFLSGVPAWDGSDVWSVNNLSLMGGDISNPVAQLPASEVTADASGALLWESKGTVDLRIDMPVAGLAMVLPVHHARLSMVLSADGTQATAGQIGGVLDTEELIVELAKLAGAFDPSLCPPSSTFESIAQQIRQASDILKDGTQDPAATCDGISIGLGFDARSASFGTPFDAPVAPDPCN